MSKTYELEGNPLIKTLDFDDEDKFFVAVAVDKNSKEFLVLYDLETKKETRIQQKGLLKGIQIVKFIPG